MIGVLLIPVVAQTPEGMRPLDTLKTWRRSSVRYQCSPSQHLAVKMDADLALESPLGDSLDVPQISPGLLLLLLLYVMLKGHLFQEAGVPPTDKVSSSSE